MPWYLQNIACCLETSSWSLCFPPKWIIDCIIFEGTVPSIWKQAKVLPHTRRAPNTMWKVIVQSQYRLRREKFLKLFWESSILPEEKIWVIPCSQYGFHYVNSTPLAIGAIHHDWIAAKKQQKNIVDRCCLTCQLPFDILDANLLMEKLEIYGEAENVAAILSSYLAGRIQCV